VKHTSGHLRGMTYHCPDADARVTKHSDQRIDAKPIDLALHAPNQCVIY
jgi:hypothetical protein